MKLAIVLICTTAAAFAAEQFLPSYTVSNDQAADIPEQDISLDDDGHFVLRFVDADGTMVQEEGFLLTDENTGEDRVLVKTGMYTYVGDDGKTVKLTYDVDAPGDIAVEE